MGMAAIFIKDTEPFEQSIDIHSTEDPMWNLVKMVK